jgi:hypothetical protein
LADNGIRELLRLAGVRPSHEKAVAWLSSAVEAVRRDDKSVVKRLLPADHNALLTNIEKSAKKLITGLERLRRHPFSQHTFWHSRAFGPVYDDRLEVREVWSMLETIVAAADMAKERGRGRRRETRKQQVVDLAFGFFVRFSPRTPSGTPTGAFARFAREFYAVATGSDLEKDGGLDRQIRHALTRLPIVLERARQKSRQKSRVSS